MTPKGFGQSGVGGMELLLTELGTGGKWQVETGLGSQELASEH